MLGRDKKSLPHAELFLSFQLGKTCLYPWIEIPKVPWCAATVLFDVSGSSLALICLKLLRSCIVWQIKSIQDTCTCQDVICCGMSKFRHKLSLKLNLLVLLRNGVCVLEKQMRCLIQRKMVVRTVDSNFWQVDFTWLACVVHCSPAKWTMQYLHFLFRKHG